MMTRRAASAALKGRGGEGSEAGERVNPKSHHCMHCTRACIMHQMLSRKPWRLAAEQSP